MKLKLFKDADGNKHHEIYLNGRDIQSPQLDDIYARVQVFEGGEVLVDFRKEDEDYLSTLDEGLLLGWAWHHAARLLTKGQFSQFLSGPGDESACRIESYA